MGSLIAGIISAAVGGIIGMINSITDSNNQINDITTQQLQMQAEYANKDKLLDLEFEKAKEEAERNAAKAEQKAESEEQDANLQDTTLDVSERALSDKYNNQLDAIQVQQESNLFNWNTALMQAGASEGASLANAAASGVRAGSTMSQAIDMQSAVNSAALQQQQDQARTGININLNSLFNNLNQNQLGIMQGRIGADNLRNDAANLRSDAAYLRESYSEGGNNYEIYKQNKSGMFLNYANNFNNLQVNKNRISGSAAWNAISSLISGGTSGFETGSKVATSIQEWSGYNGGYTIKLDSNE